LDTLASYNTQQKSESGIQLTVSDKRSSILNQLKKRFTAAQIHGKYNVLELDLEQDSSSSETILLHQTFDLVIADVPCSGSGTWARTPEQLCCFTEEMLEDFVGKQRRILANLPQAVVTGGYLLYCTCSVFERENEEQVKWFTQTYNFTIEKSIVFNGINHRADTLFACLMRKIN
jgi:16S rRNA (cytosine967-C5)-methyltransferase